MNIGDNYGGGIVADIQGENLLIVESVDAFTAVSRVDYLAYIDTLNTGVYSNWAVPTSDQFHTMFLVKEQLGWNSSQEYWSESIDPWQSKAFSMGNDVYRIMNNQNTFYARAVRTDKIPPKPCWLWELIKKIIEFIKHLWQ
jgi:hypothetical protein